MSNKQPFEIMGDLYKLGYNITKELDKSLDEQAGVEDHDCHTSPEDCCKVCDERINADVDQMIEDANF